MPSEPRRPPSERQPEQRDDGGTAKRQAASADERSKEIPESSASPKQHVRWMGGPTRRVRGGRRGDSGLKFPAASYPSGTRNQAHRSQ